MKPVGSRSTFDNFDFWRDGTLLFSDTSPDMDCPFASHKVVVQLIGCATARTNRIITPNDTLGLHEAGENRGQGRRSRVRRSMRALRCDRSLLCETSLALTRERTAHSP